MGIQVSNEVMEKGVKIGVQRFSSVSQGEWGAEFSGALNALQEAVKAEFSSQEVSAHLVIRSVRRMYSRCGTDPTKFRPCSEALVRRVLRQQPFPRILPAVDIGNFIALKYLLPLGIYDASKIFPPVEIRIGKQVETIHAIGDRIFHTEGRLVAVDQNGVFGGPTADALRTAVTPQTTSLLVLFYAPSELPIKLAMDEMASWMEKVTSARLDDSFILPPDDTA